LKLSQEYSIIRTITPSNTAIINYCITFSFLTSIAAQKERVCKINMTCVDLSLKSEKLPGFGDVTTRVEYVTKARLT
jgi:hypothetical protein